MDRKIWQSYNDMKGGSSGHLHLGEVKLISDWAEQAHLSTPATWDDTLQTQTQNKKVEMSGLITYLTKCNE